MCAVQTKPDADTACNAHHYGKDSMHYATGVKTKRRQHEFGKHRKNWMEDIDGKRIPSDVFQNGLRTFRQKRYKVRRKAQE